MPTTSASPPASTSASGGHLARLLINVFLERMAERIDTIEIAGPVVRSSNALVRVIDDLPVVMTPRAR